MKFIKYKDRYRLKVVELLNVCFEDKSITSGSFSWKHFDPIFKDKQIAYIALEKNKVCAFVCFTPININILNKKIDFYSCSVQATHPDYRRRGIISAITQIIEKELGDVNYLGFSNNSGVQIDINSKRINYSILGRLITRYILPNFKKSKLVVKKAELVDLEFIKKYSINKYGFNKSEEYLNWRYYNNPKNKFEYLNIYNNEACVAVAIVKKRPFIYECLDVLSIDSMSMKQSIDSLSNYTFLNKSIISFTYLPNDYWDAIFNAYSFNKKIDMYFTVKSNTLDLLNKNNWMISGGDIQ